MFTKRILLLPVAIVFGAFLFVSIHLAASSEVTDVVVQDTHDVIYDTTTDSSSNHTVGQTFIATTAEPLDSIQVYAGRAANHYTCAGTEFLRVDVNEASNISDPTRSGIQVAIGIAEDPTQGPSGFAGEEWSNYEAPLPVGAIALRTIRLCQMSDYFSSQCNNRPSGPIELENNKAYYITVNRNCSELQDVPGLFGYTNTNLYANGIMKGDAAYNRLTDDLAFAVRSGTPNNPHIATPRQFESNATIAIAEGVTTQEDAVVFKASVTSPVGRQVKLQVELRQFGESFTGIFDGGVISSDMVASSSTPQITRFGLVDASYKWRARTVDEAGLASHWEEFETVGNTDFVVDIPFPSGDLATQALKSALYDTASDNPSHHVVGQTFIPSRTGPVDSVKVYVGKKNTHYTCSGTEWLRVNIFETNNINDVQHGPQVAIGFALDPTQQQPTFLGQAWPSYEAPLPVGGAAVRTIPVCKMSDYSSLQCKNRPGGLPVLDETKSYFFDVQRNCEETPDVPALYGYASSNPYANGMMKGDASGGSAYNRPNDDLAFSVHSQTINVAVILAEPSDTSFALNHTKEYFKTEIIPDIRDYYCEVSFGMRDVQENCIQGLVAFGKFDVFDRHQNGEKYKLNKTENDYGENFLATTLLDINQDDQFDAADDDQTMIFAWEAIKEADADILYDDYDAVLIVHPNDSYQTPLIPFCTDCMTTEHLPIELRTDTNELTKNWVVVSENDTNAVWIHEIGHAIGNILKEESLCDLAEDTDCSYTGFVPKYLDVMGTRTVYDFIHNASSEFSSFTKLQLNWLQAEAVQYGSYALESLETALFGYKAKKYQINNSSYYLLEARTNNSEYSHWNAHLIGDPLVVYKVSSKEVNHFGQTTTINSINIAKQIGVLDPIIGIVDPLDFPFKDPQNNLVVSIDSRIADGASFRINSQLSPYNALNKKGVNLRPSLFLPALTLNQSQFGPQLLSVESLGGKIVVPSDRTNGLTIKFPAGSFDGLPQLFLFIIFVLTALFFALKVISKKASKIVISPLMRGIKILIYLFIALLVLRLIIAPVFALNNGSITIPQKFRINDIVPDLDLHAITPDGKHTGVNYTTGEYENKILGAEASGDMVYDDEWIFVSADTDVKFYVSSHDIEAFLEANPDIVQQLPSTEDFYDISAIFYDSQSNRYESQPLVNQTIDPGETIVHELIGTTNIEVQPGVVDTVGPTIVHSMVNTQYVLNASPFTFTYSAEDTLSGVKSLSAILNGNALTNGQAVNLTTPGTNTIVITAEDNAGNITTETINFTVAYTFGGYLMPVKADGTGIYNLNRTLPIRFQLTDANNQIITSATAQLFLAKIQDGIVGTDEIPLSTSAADTGNLFRYDNTESQYMYNLATSSLGVGTWQIKVILDDGKDYVVIISLH